MKRKLYIFLLAGVLSTNLFLPYVVKANNLSTNKQELNVNIVEKRKEDLNFLIKTLEEKHPNIYNKYDKTVFNEKIKSIETNLNKMTNMEFAIAVSELTALIGDSHTKVLLNNIKDILLLPLSTIQVKEGIMIITTEEKNKNLLGGIITAINGIPIDKVKEKLTPMFSYDNETYLDENFRGYFYCYEILKYYNIVESPKDITLDIEIGNKTETVKIDALDRESLSKLKTISIDVKQPETILDRNKIYFSKPLDDNILYIQYNSCKEDKNLPIQTFANQVNKEIIEKGYKKVILDLRNNGGGSDGVIRPLMNVLEERLKQDGVALYTLVGGKTFSSAVINTVMLKEIGSIIVGTSTGGSVDHFGEVGSFELPYSKLPIRYSNKFFDLATLLKSAEPYGVESFKPDIEVEQTREDYLIGKDTAVEKVKNDNSTIQKQGNLTRERLAVEIGIDLFNRKNVKATSLSKFEDVSKVSYVSPYISLVNENGIMVGIDEKQFLPNKEVTKGELAVVLVRYAKEINLSLDNIEKEDLKILYKDKVRPYQQEAVEVFAGSSILPIENNSLNLDKVVSYEEFNSIFNNFKSLIK